MKTSIQKAKLASSISLALILLSSPLMAETASQEVVNARQETQIWTTFALSPYLRANDIKVSVQNGKATLTGKVDEEVNKDLAKQIALGVNGITEVDDQIVVDPTYMAPSHTAERSYGQVVDDTTITGAVKSKLMWSKYTDGLSTTVETKSGKVKLTGTADSKKASEFAEHLAMNTRGVVAVDNQLVIKDKSPTVADKAKQSEKKTEQNISDSWITTKVKYTFLYSRNVSGSDIDVSTSSGVVSLRGKLGSGAERALAIELAQNVRGVKAVNAHNLTE